MDYFVARTDGRLKRDRLVAQLPCYGSGIAQPFFLYFPVVPRVENAEKYDGGVVRVCSFDFWTEILDSSKF